MDYWEYLAHGQKGAERDGHRYYARELVGNRGGKNVYRYFYTAEEYSAYKKSKGTPGRGTYAETGRSRDAAIWPKGTAKAHERARHQQSVAGQKKVLDRARHKAGIENAKAKMDERRVHRESVAAQKKGMDDARIRAQHKQSVTDQKKSLDRARHKASIGAQKKQMDTARARAEHKASVASQKQELDNARKRKEHQQSVRRQKVRMDAKRTRAKRRDVSRAGRDFMKRVMDNTRTRKSYSPTRV